MSEASQKRAGLVLCAILFFLASAFLPVFVPFDVAVAISTISGLAFGAWFFMAWISADSL